MKWWLSAVSYWTENAIDSKMRYYLIIHNYLIISSTHASYSKLLTFKYTISTLINSYHSFSQEEATCNGKIVSWFLLPSRLSFTWSNRFNHISLLEWVLVPLRRQWDLSPLRIRKAKQGRFISSSIGREEAVNRK